MTIIEDEIMMGKDTKLFKKIFNIAWVITHIKGTSDFAVGDQFHLTKGRRQTIDRVLVNVQSGEPDFDIRFTNSDFTPVWFTIDSFLYIHILHGEDSEFVFRFYLPEQGDNSFEFWSAHLPDFTSHGRGGGGN